MGDVKMRAGLLQRDMAAGPTPLIFLMVVSAVLWWSLGILRAVDGRPHRCHGLDLPLRPQQPIGAAGCAARVGAQVVDVPGGPAGQRHVRRRAGQAHLALPGR